MEPERTLGVRSAAAAVVASMIGAGVFTTSGYLLADLGAGGWVLLAWAVGGVLSTLGALCYGALARAMPESGGEYLFLARTLHPFAGFLAGWISLWVGFAAPQAAAAFAFGEYASPWFGQLDPRASGTAALLAAAGLHAWRVRAGAGVQDIVVLLKLVLVVGFLVAVAVQVPAEAWAGALAFEGGSGAAGAGTAGGGAPELGAFAVAVMFVSFSYSGWNAAAYIGGEVRDPERNLPRALLLGCGLVTLLYLALNAAFLAAAPAEDLVERVDIGRVAASAVGGRALEEIVAVVIALALLTSVSAMAMLGPRVYARMAIDGAAPRVFAAAGPPRAAIALQTSLAIALLWSASFEQILFYIGVSLGLGTLVTVIGLVVHRRRVGADALPVPGWPWVPAAFGLGTAGLIALSLWREPVSAAYVAGTLVAGALLWPWFRKTSRRPVS